ncbi:polysaccharide pyruvyl transferase family protein [Cellvibrio japonicus]|uniref:Polysaccharide pyruvyl transferase domain-containing protein n=1 Tax=Cellvibrio japonicus (strain Ueda107) TaxID=498211 RepID=B3PFY9_CELJU|nr:polysaccharide pyruvyl transferase family protein [Cellvibrio japonicus]ACE83117.1 conserved hypothetical protein [Cellvibrio japonicus Ueda107]QEI13678.1 polysaccharide pyruvyl transferase family protein [Cellvibrio japonicus]QEI17252.1 polysaccharide pyruvyl transferase family protein [Cellvibrio japonicus]QEI20829.1 polysaccharide pyruvyl transferase family protein [Cellvibrio japonicus]
MTIMFRCDPPRIGLTAHLDTHAAASMVGLNPGNLAFGYATALLLGFPRNTHFLAPVDAQETIGVYACANLLGSHYDPSHFLNFVNTSPSSWKMLLIGLGAQGPLDRLTDNPNDLSLSDIQISWLNAVCSRSTNSAPNIAVRGGFSHGVLNKYGYGDRAVTTGCPSLLLSPDKNLGKKIVAKFNTIGSNPLLDGTLGNPWDLKHAPFEQHLLRLVIATGGVSHVQMDKRHMSLARFDQLSQEDLAELRFQLSPETSISGMRDFGRRHLRVWWDVPSWMEYLRRADFVFGSRIHGITLALQSGTPAMCAVWDSRTLELCRAMGIPHVSLYDQPWITGRFSFDDLREEFAKQFDGEGFDQNRKLRANQFLEIFTRNGVPVTDHLRNIAS